MRNADRLSRSASADFRLTFRAERPILETMEISSSQDGPVQIAVQAQMLNMMQTQGAGLVNMVASANIQRGSVNQPGQGLRIDVHV